MPHDVIMPALGMAQDTGLIVSWHKSEGDEVSVGDVLFEVETDKATVEVEAAESGFLVGVSANAGENVPVGNVIAVISETNEAPAGASAPSKPEASEASPAETEALPEGHEVIMPTLGMAQDSGLLVNWLHDLSAKIAADDPLFEVETDKSTMEVPAGADGYLSAILAEAGENVPTGEVIAVISETMPENGVRRAYGGASAPAAEPTKAAPKAEAPKADTQKPKPQARKAIAANARPMGARVLASPKARRIAMERGLSLEDLRQAGLAEPFHAADVETFVPRAKSAGGGASMTLKAKAKRASFDEFVAWAQSEDQSLTAANIFGSFALRALQKPSGVVRVQNPEQAMDLLFDDSTALQAQASEDEAACDIVIHDLRNTCIQGAEALVGDAPQLVVTQSAKSLKISLHLAPETMDAKDAIALLDGFAARIENPLRHLL